MWYRPANFSVPDPALLHDLNSRLALDLVGVLQPAKPYPKSSVHDKRSDNRWVCGIRPSNAGGCDSSFDGGVGASQLAAVPRRWGDGAAAPAGRLSGAAAPAGFGIQHAVPQNVAAGSRAFQSAGLRSGQQLLAQRPLQPALQPSGVGSDFEVAATPVNSNATARPNAVMLTAAKANSEPAHAPKTVSTAAYGHNAGDNAAGGFGVGNGPGFAGAGALGTGLQGSSSAAARGLTGQFGGSSVTNGAVASNDDSFMLEMDLFGGNVTVSADVKVQEPAAGAADGAAAATATSSSAIGQRALQHPSSAAAAAAANTSNGNADGYIDTEGEEEDDEVLDLAGLDDVGYQDPRASNAAAGAASASARPLMPVEPPPSRPRQQQLQQQHQFPPSGPLTAAFGRQQPQMQVQGGAGAGVVSASAAAAGAAATKQLSSRPTAGASAAGVGFPAGDYRSSMPLHLQQALGLGGGGAPVLGINNANGSGGGAGLATRGSPAPPASASAAGVGSKRPAQQHGSTFAAAGSDAHASAGASSAASIGSLSVSSSSHVRPLQAVLGQANNTRNNGSSSTATAFGSGRHPLSLQGHTSNINFNNGSGTVKVDPDVSPIDPGFCRAPWVHKRLVGISDWTIEQPGAGSAGANGTDGGNKRSKGGDGTPVSSSAIAEARTNNNQRTLISLLRASPQRVDLGQSNDTASLFLQQLMASSSDTAGSSTIINPAATRQFYLSQAPAGAVASITLSIVGGKADPDDAIAVVMMVRMRGTSGSASGPQQHQMLQCQTYVLPLLPDAELCSAYKRASASMSAASAMGYQTGRDGGQPVTCIARSERWNLLSRILALPNIPKHVYDSKSSLYGLMRCPLLARNPINNLFDPSIAAWMLSPDTVASKDCILIPDNKFGFDPVDKTTAGIYTGMAGGAGAAGFNFAAGMGAGSRYYTGSGSISAAQAPSASDDSGGPSLQSIGMSYGVPGPRNGPSSAAASTSHPAFSHLMHLAATCDALSKELCTRGLDISFRDQEMKLVPALVAVETTGLAVDTRTLADIETRVRNYATQLERNIRSHVPRSWTGGELNVRSPKQLAELLYDHLKLVPQERAEAYNKHAPKGGHRHKSTDEQALEAMSNQHPICGLIVQYRKVDKVAHTYTSPYSTCAVRREPADLPFLIRGVELDGAASAAVVAAPSLSRSGGARAGSSSSSSSSSDVLILDEDEDGGDGNDGGASPAFAGPRFHVGGCGGLLSAKGGTGIGATSFAARFGGARAAGSGAGDEILLPRNLGPLDASLARVYTQLNQCSTATGRLSSSDPNLQNLPREGKDANTDPVVACLPAGVSIRGAFKSSGPGCVLVSFDYSQIEMRILAHVSGDQQMLRIFREGAASASSSSAAGTAAGSSSSAQNTANVNKSDIYAQMAAHANGIPLHTVTPDQRNQSKTVVLGLVYGMGIPDMARKLNISDQQAYAIHTAFLRRFPGITAFIQGTAVRFAQRYGHVITITGRRRLLPDIAQPDMNKMSYAARQAVNTVIQGSAADVIKQAMICVDERMRQRSCSESSLTPGVGAGPAAGAVASSSSNTSQQRQSQPVPPGRLLLQIHDELLFECPNDPASLAALSASIKQVMTIEVPKRIEQLSRAWLWGRINPQDSINDPTAHQYRVECSKLLGGYASLQVPLAVNVEAGPDFGNLKKID